MATHYSEDCRLYFCLDRTIGAARHDGIAIVVVTTARGLDRYMCVVKDDDNAIVDEIHAGAKTRKEAQTPQTDTP